ncbi:tetratricopeptide repeat protein [Uruburuella testudinis]|uniref:Ancillary SecYEG translocon subunit n=1 Tax=Uruburuella testudinis TaxID=1282863 RepID=A0ABY4DP67_9NEIS|nr:tetratricopeptide repeat protein [Uruburuella testudinis]UOO80851.1 tetratricopeptide repeat protein [Uruburuella testudinis]
MATHIQDQEELENFKYFWKSWGRWLFTVLVLVALAYLGHVWYQNHQLKKDQQAAEVLAQMVEKAQNQGDQNAIRADLADLQQNYPGSIAAAQGTLMAAATEFDNGKYDVAEGHLNWVLKNQKAPLVQALAAQRLAIVYLQQKKYTEALTALDTPVDADFEPLLLETKGDVYAAEGKAKEALAAYEQTLNKLPKEAGNRELLQLKADQLK